jgi:hypothetical protein
MRADPSRRIADFFHSILDHHRPDCWLREQVIKARLLVLVKRP